MLISIGPSFLLQTVMQTLLLSFAKHSNSFRSFQGNDTWEVHLEGMTRYILISNGLLSPMLVVICIPFYLCWIRPCIKYCLPAILTRMKIAILVIILSIICNFIMDIIVHVRDTVYANCMFGSFANPPGANIVDVNTTDFRSSLPLFLNVHFFTTQNFLSALADMLLDIAIFEFVCS